MTKFEWCRAIQWLAFGACLSVSGCSEDDSAAFSTIEYDDGYVEFVDAGANPRRVFQLRGEMKVAVYENYLRVVLDDDDQTYFIPRERVVYAGVEIK